MPTTIRFYHTFLDRDHRNICMNPQLFSSIIANPLYSKTFPGDIVATFKSPIRLSISRPINIALPNYCTWAYSGVQYFGFVEPNNETDETITLSISIDWLNTFFNPLNTGKPSISVSARIVECSARSGVSSTYPAARCSAAYSAKVDSFNFMTISFAATITKSNKSEEFFCVKRSAFNTANPVPAQNLIALLSYPEQVEVAGDSGFAISNVRNVQIFPSDLSTLGAFETNTYVTIHSGSDSATFDARICSSFLASSGAGTLEQTTRSYPPAPGVQRRFGNTAISIQIPSKSDTVVVGLKTRQAGDCVKLYANVDGSGDVDMTAATMVPFTFSSAYAERQANATADALKIVSSGVAIGAGVVTGSPMGLIGGTLGLASTVAGIAEREESSKMVSAQGFWRDVFNLRVLGIMAYQEVDSTAPERLRVLGLPCDPQPLLMNVSAAELLNWIADRTKIIDPDKACGYVRLTGVRVAQELPPTEYYYTVALPPQYLDELVAMLERGVTSWNMIPPVDGVLP